MNMNERNKKSPHPQTFQCMCRKVSVNALEKIKIMLKYFLHGSARSTVVAPSATLRSSPGCSSPLYRLKNNITFFGGECVWLDDAHQFATCLETDQITSQVMLCFPMQGSYHLHTEGYPCHISASLASSS